MKSLILASSSARRAQLLELVNIPFIVMPSYVNEEFNASLSPERIPQLLSERKADAVYNQIEDKETASILAADTTVVLGKETINKPADEKEALEMLKKLSGKTHHVITGVCLIIRGEKEIFKEITSVEFYTLSDEQINYYIKNYKPFDKAGGYAIQEWIGLTGIKSIHGDYYNVMGLPVAKIYHRLKANHFI